jgi:HD superfamily phosphodiesterase
METAVGEAFPELDRIEDDDLRAGVAKAWATAMAETGVEDLGRIPWFPPTQREHGIEDEWLVPHVRDVTLCAADLAERLHDRRGADVSLDTVLAGALVHDVSKLYEFDGWDDRPVYDLLGHPYYGVHAVAAADLPVELAHVVLSHSSRTTVEPATIEAEIVRRADEAAAAAIKAEALGDLRDE